MGANVANEVADEQFLMPTEGIIAITGGNGALGLVFGDWLLDKAAEQKVGGFEIKFLSRSTKVSDQNMPAWNSIQKKAKKLNKFDSREDSLPIS